jgi:pimeloyl-ACP methyl ester carboxylesterase
VYLAAGERSVSNWNVPDWARAAAHGSATLPDAGHMVMLEQPAAFGQLMSELLTTKDANNHRLSRCAVIRAAQP